MKIVITGGAGFIGCNAAAHYLKKGDEVVVFDNLSRVNSDHNLKWLQSNPGRLALIVGDMRSTGDMGKLVSFVDKADVILHLAGQVAVTTSITNPREDFEINALGTLNLLEAMRTVKSKAKLIYASTNKVYGQMEDIKIRQSKTRYEYADNPNGISESRLLDFHSPYGCSKGAADQYVHDYGRIYGLDTVVMRQSCIYGPHQFGVEDQGWVAWFIIAALLGKPITIYGNGKQVRDVLFIEDLLSAYDKAIRAGNKTRGEIYNIGGGKTNTISIWQEFGLLLQSLIGKSIRVRYDSWRLGDQPVYISDIKKAHHDFGWKPTTDISTGILTLVNWVRKNKPYFIHST